jgi:hypothetical protein
MEQYDMSREARGKVMQFAKDNNLPLPGNIYKGIYTALIVQHKLSIIMGQIDETLDRIMLLNDRVRMVIEEGNLTALVMLKERKAEELVKLAALERILDRESPVKRIPKEGELTQDMIDRARDYPFESLLPEELKRGRCRCPIHNGVNVMSFTVKNNYGRCFSCSWHGDTIKYIMDTQGISFVEAVRRLQ